MTQFGRTLTLTFAFGKTLGENTRRKNCSALCMPKIGAGVSGVFTPGTIRLRLFVQFFRTWVHSYSGPFAHGPFVFSYQACLVLVKMWDYAVMARTLPAPEPYGDSHQTLAIGRTAWSVDAILFASILQSFLVAVFLVNDQIERLG